MNPYRPSRRRGLTLVCVIGCALVTSAARREPNPPTEERPILVGRITKADLQKAPFAAWFDSQYSAYEPKAQDLASLQGALQGVTVEAYLGTWCGDSRRQIPKLLKLLELVGVDEKRISLVALSDRSLEFKQAPGNPEAKRRVHRTPTIVFLRAEVEIGRIVETPATSLEGDLLAILQGHGPEPRYGAEAWINDLFADLPPAEVEQALLTAEPEIRKRGNPDSLWHYAEFDLLKNGRAREAEAVLDLHLRLDPRSVIGHVLMAEALMTLGRQAEATAAVERALAIEPQNRRALQAAAKLRSF